MESQKQKAMRRAESLSLKEERDEIRHPKMVAGMRLVAYTVSMMVFGMICSALGPSIPWLAENAEVSPETLGYLPAAQAVMCIISGLASSVVALLPRRFHHRLLCLLTLWLAGFFAVLPLASSSIYALVVVYALQVLPRPWIGQMTNLLVSQLFEDPSISSAAQSLNQGGFALGCVSMVLLEQYGSEAFGGAAVFYMAGGFTALSAFLFLVLPRLEDDLVEKDIESNQPSQPKQSLSISAFSIAAAGLGVLAVGVEVACGTWLITAMTQMGFDSSVSSSSTVVFWILFAMSRLVLAPLFCKIFRPKASSVVIVGATFSAVGCIPAAIWPQEISAILVGVAGVALGAGPSYSMIISMAKERRSTGLNSIDSAMFFHCLFPRRWRSAFPDESSPSCLWIWRLLPDLAEHVRCPGGHDHHPGQKCQKSQDAHTVYGVHRVGVHGVHLQWWSKPQPRVRRVRRVSGARGARGARDHLDLLGTRMAACSCFVPGLRQELGGHKSRTRDAEDLSGRYPWIGPRAESMETILGASCCTAIRSFEIGYFGEVRWHLGWCHTL